MLQEEKLQDEKGAHMKFAISLLFLIGSISQAHADGGVSGYFGNRWDGRDEFRVLENANGQITLLDLQLGKTYIANTKTGMEFPLDVSFLNESLSPFVRENAKYIKSATVSAKKITTGQYAFEIKAVVGMPLVNSPGDFNALIVLTGETFAQNDYIWNGHHYPGNYEEKFVIHSVFKVDRLEDVSKSPSNSMLFAGLNMVLKLFPKKGIYSELIQN